VVAHPVRDIALLGVDLALAVDPGVAGIELGDRQVQVGSVQAVRHQGDPHGSFDLYAPDHSHPVDDSQRPAAGVATDDPVPARPLLHREHRRVSGWNCEADIEVDLSNV